jgi:hypothetical protein
VCTEFNLGSDDLRIWKPVYEYKRSAITLSFMNDGTVVRISNDDDDYGNGKNNNDAIAS